jgi:prepilin-type N-terminal cleavage/methylation domain-containing protein
MNKKNKAFTLIELLVVIAIVGILSGFIFVSMTSAINSAKDAKRKADLSSIEKALLVYGANHSGTYPYSALDTYPCNLTGSTNLCANTNLSTALSPYLGTLPTDPNGTSYTYTGVADASSFILTGTLSNGNSYYYSSPNLTWTETSSPFIGWGYKKTITLSSSLTQDYQIKLTIPYGAGGCESHCNTDFSDLRFASTSGTTLSYWIESYTASTTATVWVKALNGSSAFNMYYGKTGTTTTANGDNTFNFFDDFIGTTLNTAKWTTVPTQGYSVSGSQLTFNFNTSTWNQLGESVFTLAPGYMVTTYENYAGYSGSTVRGWFNIWNTGPMTNWDTWSGTGLHLRNAWGDAGALIYSGTGWHKVEKYFDGSSTQYVRVDGGAWSSRDGGAIGSTGGLQFGAYSTSAAGYHYFDYVFVRKYQSPEPTVTFGGEANN